MLQATHKLIARQKLRSLLSSILIFCLSLALGIFIIVLERDYLQERLRTSVSHHAVDVASRLQSEINANVFLANGLIALITAYPREYKNRIQPALKSLHDINPNLRNIGIAPNNRIAHVYPVEGNEAAIGLYYPDIPSQWPAVQKAIETRSTVLAGPVNLAQGGIALISRTPVFLDGGDYWGIISLVINIEQLLQDVYGDLHRMDISYAVRNTTPLNLDNVMIYGDPVLFAQDSIQIQLRVPGGSWQLAAMPTAGWRVNPKLMGIFCAVAILVSICLSAIWYVLQQQRLRVQASELYLRTIMQTTNDGLVVTDGHGVIQLMNAAVENISGYTVDEVCGQSISSLLPHNSDELTKWLFDHTQQKDDNKQHRMVIRHKDGHKVPVEITIAEAVLNKQILYISAIREISERLRLEKRLKAMANTDSLTGVFNRRAIENISQRQFKFFRRTGEPFTILMLDLDHFKTVNDTYGHKVGDDTLIATVEVLKTCLRETDYLGRYGGEEFIALLPATPGTAAQEVAQRICDAIRTEAYRAENGVTFSATISIGVAEISDTDHAVIDCIKRADQALYQAKDAGRDRFVLAENIT